MKQALPARRSTLHRVVCFFVGCILCFAFYAALCYLIPRSYAPLKVIAKESVPRFGRFLLAAFGIGYGCFAYHQTETVFLSQIPNLLCCFAMRLYCHYKPPVEPDPAASVTTVIKPAWNAAPTVPEWILLVLYTLIPVGLSLAVSYTCRQYRREVHRAGKDRILLDPKSRRT